MHPTKRCWDAVQNAGEVVWTARFSAFTLAAGGALLVMTDQGQELAVAMDGKGAVSGAFFTTGRADGPFRP